MYQESFLFDSAGQGFHPGLLKFVSRYERAQRQALDAAEAYAAKKRSKAPDPHNEFAHRARQEWADVQDRMQNGFRLKWARKVAGRVRQPFTMMGLPSEDNPILQLFVARVPKGGKARASEDKGTLYVPSRYKLLTLDNPYIEFNKIVLGMIRIDCDAVFETSEACREELERLVEAKAIPHLPHIVTGDLMPDGTYSHPHFYFMLPPGSEVWNDFGDSRCRKDVVKLFNGVSKGLVKALLPLGADPAAPRLTMRGKNPLSPYWKTLILNTTEFMTLKEYAKVVDTRASMEELVRQSAAAKSTLGLKPSNEAFNKLSDRANAVLRDWHFNCDPRMDGSSDKLSYHLHEELERYAQSSGMDEVEMAHVLANVASYRALFDPTKLSQKGKDKGRLMHEVAEVKSVAKRMSMGADYSAKIRSLSAMDKMIEAMMKAMDDGRTMSVEALAAAAKVSRSYAYKAYAECQQICLSGGIVKKDGTATPGPKETVVNTDPVVETVEPRMSGMRLVESEDFEPESPAPEPAWRSYDPDEDFERAYNFFGRSCNSPVNSSES
jgi:hypothetical protein